ncbi:unnamed protein product [Alopecurus aequalis]
MASKLSCSFLMAALLVSVFAAATATGDYCYPGMGIPSNPLPSCRDYVVHQTCGVRILGARYLPVSTMRERCCLELSQIREHCRCEALGYFSERPSTHRANILKDLPGCPWEPQRDFAKILVTPAECNLQTKYNAPYCLKMEEL